ncbi:MAG: polysaccharide biosynthesis/export family protein [Candidatus Kapaibacteriota bacterium]
MFFVQEIYAQSKRSLAIDTNTVNVNEIPDENVLRSSGLKEEEIIQILEFKKRKLSAGGGNTQNNTNQTPVDLETKSTLRAKVDSVQTVNAINAKPKSSNEIFGQDLFINNNFEKYNLSANIKAQDNYIIGVGDEISVSVYGYSYFNDVFKVSENGKINIDKIGPIHVQGLTFAATKNLIKSKLRQYFDLSNNKVDITLSFSRVISVNFVGEVNNPGTYKIPANTTLFNSLISVGGPNDYGSLRNIQVKRAGKLVYKLDVYEFLYNPSKIKEFYLENNDFVFFESIKKVVEIRGEVKKPYKYELLENENIIKLIER